MPEILAKVLTVLEITSAITDDKRDIGRHSDCTYYFLTARSLYVQFTTDGY